MSYQGLVSALCRGYLSRIESPSVLEIGTDRGQTTLPLLHRLIYQHGERGRGDGFRYFGFADRDYDTEMVGEFDGEETVGAETFRKMYERMGFKRAVWFSRLPLVRNVFNSGYYIFAHWIRPYLPKKRPKS